MTDYNWDAIVIGSGPNGLSAALRLSLAGLKVKVLEAKDTIGGGTRSAELIREGTLHDLCSAIHPLALASPFFRALPLEEHGVRWIHPPLPLYHPLDDGDGVALHRDFNDMQSELGGAYEEWKSLVGPYSDKWRMLVKDLLAPARLPRHPLLTARFALDGIWPATKLIQSRLQNRRSAALFAGMASHSVQSLDRPLTSAVALLLSILGHSTGWPIAEGGSKTLSAALATLIRKHGGEIETGVEIRKISQLPPARALLFDLSPSSLESIAANELPYRFRKQLKNYRHGPGVFKIDYLLSEPVPWLNQSAKLAGTLHLGGFSEEIIDSEKAMGQGRHHKRPFVLAAQQSLFDSLRTSGDEHTFWAYCHVPAKSNRSMTQEIENQIERFAPGFRDVIQAKHTITAHELESWNPNYIGGDINGGVQDLRQHFRRPVSLFSPYSTPNPRIWICSASTPPGGGVHGMCGFYAAEAVLKNRFQLRSKETHFDLETGYVSQQHSR
ncbi:MAG: NAD(P)/FAD-dependent oxidoreductase [Balneolaceae bacterium]